MPAALAAHKGSSLVCSPGKPFPLGISRLRQHCSFFLTNHFPHSHFSFYHSIIQSFSNSLIHCSPFTLHLSMVTKKNSNAATAAHALPPGCQPPSLSHPPSFPPRFPFKNYLAAASLLPLKLFLNNFIYFTFFIC